MERAARGREARGRAAQAVNARLAARRGPSDVAVTHARVRETLDFLGFEEIAPGTYVRLDGPYGRARHADEARVFTTVRVDQVVGSAVTLARIVQRFARVHGPVQR